MRRRKGSAAASKRSAAAGRQRKGAAEAAETAQANGRLHDEDEIEAASDEGVDLEDEDTAEESAEIDEESDEKGSQRESEGDDEDSDDQDSEDDDDSEDDGESEDDDSDDGEDSDADPDEGTEEESSSDEHAEALAVADTLADDAEAGDVLEAVAGEGADDGAAAASCDVPPLTSVIEGVLFASAEPVPMRRLVRLLSSWSRDEVELAVNELRSSLEQSDRGIRLVEAAGGLQLRSSERLAPWVRSFFAERPPRLSRPVLETLAIIAYRQPVTRGEVEQIRGVNCDAVLGALTTRGLIQIQGRRASPGRPAEYGTTQTFLELFTLRDLAELPPLPDPTALANLVVGESDVEADGDESERGPDAGGSDDEASVAASAEGESSEGAAAEDPEPGGDGLPEDGRGPDPERPGEGEREDRPGAGDEGGSDPGSDHG